jgi:hypothetical protein
VPTLSRLFTLSILFILSILFTLFILPSFSCFPSFSYFPHFSHRFHTGRTSISPRRFIFKTTHEGTDTSQVSPSRIQNSAAVPTCRPLGHAETKKEALHMFLGLDWYWWIVIIVALIIVIPLKVKFVNWWNRCQQEARKNEHGKWGDE